jgi:hypothetical protein
MSKDRKFLLIMASFHLILAVLVGNIPNAVLLFVMAVMYAYLACYYINS